MDYLEYNWFLVILKQILHSLLVAIFSGIVATVLFFRATDIVKSDIHKLAIVESTQSAEVIFTLLDGIFIFHDKMPRSISLIGITLVIIGMVLNSLIDL